MRSPHYIEDTRPYTVQRKGSNTVPSLFFLPVARVGERMQVNCPSAGCGSIPHIDGPMKETGALFVQVLLQAERVWRLRKVQ
jgi:hypothetical protein